MTKRRVGAEGVPAKPARWVVAGLVASLVLGAAVTSVPAAGAARPGRDVTTTSILEVDEGSDGVVDTRSVQTVTRDSTGNIVAETYEFDADANGQYDVRSTLANTYVPGTSHLLTATSTIDQDGDGAEDVRDVLSNTYASDGTLQSVLKQTYDGAGTLVYEEIQRYENTDTVSCSVVDVDDDGDGFHEQQIEHCVTSNAIGQVIEQRVIITDSGVISSDRVVSYTYDDAGLQVGRVDATTTGLRTSTATTTDTYDAANRLTESSTSYDDDTDGTAEAIDTSRFVYGSRGELLTQEWYHDDLRDNTLDDFYRTDYQYDSKLRLTRSIEDISGRTVVIVTDYVYDAKGRVTQTVVVTEVAGTKSRVTTDKVYDGKLLVQTTQTTDNTNDGVPDAIEIERYTYRRGVLTTIVNEYDDDADGTIDRSTTRHFR